MVAPLLDSLIAGPWAGLIPVFESTDICNSYAQTVPLGPDGGIIERVVQVAEKKVISNNATCGVYYWTKGSTFVHSARWMISSKDMTNGEYYVCPAYNQALSQGWCFLSYKIDNHVSLGTPEHLEAYLGHS